MTQGPRFRDRTRIAERLWIGAAPEEGTLVRSYGFDVLVLCAVEYQPRFRVPFQMSVHLDDGGYPPAPQDLPAAHRTANELAYLLAANKTALVTCWQGRNRSGLVVTLALRRRYGATGTQAREFVQSKRRMALTNPWFAAHLDSLSAPRTIVRLPPDSSKFHVSYR